MRLHYEVGKFYLYQNNDEMLKLIEYVQCDSGDGRGECYKCNGKLKFENEAGKIFITCGWIYNHITKEYEPKYRRT